MGDPSALAIDGGEPVRRRPFPPGGPEIAPEDAEAVAEVVRSGRLWRHAGNLVSGLEQAFAALHGVVPESVVASTSGTAALHLALGAIDPAPGDEVIVPPISDFGTVIPVLAQNAVPVFADVLPDTYCLDAEDAARRISARTRAIVAVHLFGQPCDLLALRQLAGARGLALVEDCAQAPLAEFGGRPVGTHGDFGCFSLQQSKHVTAGEGGLTICRDPGAAAEARLFADKGWPRAGQERTHVRFGMNYRMTEMQGAVAAAQLPRLPGIVARRRAFAAQLDAALRDVPGVAVPAPAAGARSAYWMYGFNVEGPLLERGAAAFARAVRAEGVPLASGYVTPLYLLPVLRERRLYGGSGFPFGAPCSRPQPDFAPGLCPHAESLGRRLCHLAVHQSYGPEEAADAGAAIRKVALAFARGA